MGLGAEKLYVTNLGMEDTDSGQILLSEQCPIQRIDGDEIWYTSHNSLGQTLFHVPNFLNIEPGDGSFEVVLESCQEETGLYGVDCDEEVWLCNYKPKFIDGSNKIKFSESGGDGELSINMDLGTKKGDIVNVRYRKK